MQRRAAAMTRRRCLCAVVFVCALGTSPSQAEQPQYLKAPESAVSGSPFDAALRDDAPPKQYGSYRYLGRDSDTNNRSRVVFADEGPPIDVDALIGGAEEPERLFGHARIEQTQYPLDEPPAASAPDEPAILLQPQTTGHQPWVSASGLSTEVTSVLGSGDDLGITTLSLRWVIESPHLKGFSIRPVFGLHAIGGPMMTDLPGQLYDVSVEARMYWPFGDRWLGEFALAPGIFSDFVNTSSDAIRIVGRGIGYYKWSDTLRLAIGVAYLDRQDIGVLPLGGVIWTPNDDWRYEIMLPRPRIAHRYWSDGDHERWMYVLGEFGGGSWAIERAGGAADIATYRDYRLIFGVEFQYESGASWRLEAGYAFSRQLEYASTIGDYKQDAAALVRAALSF